MGLMKKYGIVLISAILLFITPIQGGGLKKVGQSGMKWLSIPIGARAAGIGYAYSAVANDASSVFWNPAGIAHTEGVNVFVNRTSWFADMNVNSAVVTYNSGSWGVLALSYSGMDYGILNGTRRDNSSGGYIETGEFSPTAFSAGLTYGKKISNKFSIGGTIRYLSENLGATYEGTFDSPEKFTAKMNLFAFDFGTIYYTGYKDFRIAMNIQNFGKDGLYRLEHFSLPLAFRFGAAMDLLSLFEETEMHKLTFSIDAVLPRDYSERMHFGLEYAFSEMFFLRGGYKTNYDEEDISFGTGVEYEISGFLVGVDYSYILFKNLSDVQLLSVTLGLK